MYEVPRVVKFIETESIDRTVVPGREREVKWRVVLLSNAYGVSVLQDEKQCKYTWHYWTVH